MNGFRVPANKPLLIINLGGMGDLILSSPAARALLAAAGPRRSTMLTSPQGCETARWLFPDIAVHGLYLDTSILHGIRNAQTIVALRRQRFALAVNMRTMASDTSAARMKMLIKAIGPAASAGRDTDGRGAFFDVSIAESALGDMSEAAYDCALAEELGCAVPDRRVTLPVRDDDRSRLLDFLRARGAGSGILVGIHAGGKKSHQWPIERFVAVMRSVHAGCGCTFMLTGAGSERHTAARLAAEAKVPAVVCAGELTVAQTAALIEQCALFITNDCGPMHIAAAVRVPLIAIFGPGYLRRYDPRHASPQARVFQGAAACAPCDRILCDSAACLGSVGADEVAKAAIEALRMRLRGAHRERVEGRV